MTEWRLVLSHPDDAYTNMAVDHAILNAYRNGTAAPTLRIYQWNPPGISLGRFQDADTVVRRDACARRRISVVRRMTGGEAIYHDDEVTYSIVCSAPDLALPRSVKESYKALTGFLRVFYASFGLTGSFFETADIPGQRVKARDFCFSTAGSSDITIRGKKIGGNAQRRVKDIIFQHGSIPLSLDLERIQELFCEDIRANSAGMTALSAETGASVDAHDAGTRLAAAFSKHFDVTCTQADLTAFEKDEAKRLHKEIYANLNKRLSRAGNIPQAGLA